MMERKKLGAGLIALVAGIVLSVGSASAHGYLQGDPASGKLVPYYQASGNLTTVIGIENVYSSTDGDSGTSGTNGYWINVHISVLSVASVEIFNTNLCLSAYDFGFIVLQEDPASGAQLDELSNPDRSAKVVYASVSADFINSEGYVTLAVTNSDPDGCPSVGSGVTDPSVDGLAVWTVIQDVGTGFFATEIPSTTAAVDGETGAVECAHSGDINCGGLIPEAYEVIARYDINPDVQSETTIFIWLASVAGAETNNGEDRDPTVSGFLQCEDELQISTTIPVPNEINLVDPSTLGGVGQCIQAEQFRGVLRFEMPDTGFVWSHVSQKGQNFRMNFLGYNLDSNSFTH
jgi:hypothetical protein